MSSRKSKAPAPAQKAPTDPLLAVYFRLTPDGPEVVDFGEFHDSDIDQMSVPLPDGTEVVLLGDDANFSEPDAFIAEVKARAPLATIKLALRLAREIAR